MITIRRIVKNIISLFTSQFIVLFLSLLLSIFIARFLGDVALGIYTFAMVFPKLFLVFLDLGYETLFVREVSRNKSLTSEYIQGILGFKLFIAPLIIFIIVITINLMGYPEITKNLVYLFSIFIIFTSLSALFTVTFRAYEKMEYEAFVLIITSLIRVFLSVYLIIKGFGLIEIGFVYVFTGIIELIISYFICRFKFIKPKIKFDISFIKKTIKIAIPLAIMSIFGFIFVKIDTVMLSIMEGNAVVGWYNAAYNLTSSFTPIPLLIMNALLPFLSYNYISSKEVVQKSYEISFKYLLYLGLPLVIGIFLLADKFIFLFYGNQFTNSNIALKILAWDIILKFLYLCSSYVLISINKQKQMAFFVIATAFLNIILNLILIPILSYVGAGIATLLTESFLLGSYIYLTKRESYNLNIKNYLIKPIIASGLMAYFIYSFSEINLILQILSAIIIYFGILILIKGFSNEDLQLFKHLIKKNKQN